MVFVVEELYNFCIHQNSLRTSPLVEDKVLNVLRRRLHVKTILVFTLVLARRRRNGSPVRLANNSRDRAGDRKERFPETAWHRNKPVRADSVGEILRFCHVTINHTHTTHVRDAYTPAMPFSRCRDRRQISRDDRVIAFSTGMFTFDWFRHPENVLPPFVFN